MKTTYLYRLCKRGGGKKNQTKPNEQIPADIISRHLIVRTGCDRVECIINDIVGENNAIEICIVPFIDKRDTRWKRHGRFEGFH